MRRGELKNFYMTGDKTESLSFLDAIKFLECEPAEQSARLGEKFFAQYKANTVAFENLFGELAVTQSLGRNDKILQTLKSLRSVISDSERVELDKIIAAYRRGDIPASDLKKFSQGKDFGKIKEIIGEYYLCVRNNSFDDADKKIFEDTLTKKYQHEDFCRFVTEFFSGMKIIAPDLPQEPPSNFSEHVKE